MPVYLDILDASGLGLDDPHYEPPCDVSGNCEPFDGEEHHAEAMCRFCGGWRRRDYPFPGNWGIPD